MLKRTIAPFFLAAALFAGCAAIQQVGLPSPEAQITAGAQAGAAATVTANTLLRDHKITVPQAKTYRNVLAAGLEGLKDANTDLLACRTATGSTEKTTPDPCWGKVSDVVRIALESIASVKKTVDSK
jgi:uncharacterized cupredoxin-like copper-binding protein